MEEDPSSLLWFALALLLLCSAFFSAAEVALLRITKARAESLKDSKSRAERQLYFLVNHPKDLLVTILIGNNVANIGASVLTTLLFTRLLGEQWLGAVVGGLTLVVLIFGEIFPKTIAHKHFAVLAPKFAPPLTLLRTIFYPLVYPLTKLLNALEKDGVSAKDFSDEELLALADIGHKEGSLDAEETERIANVLEFGDTTAKQVMTPRPQMNTLTTTMTLAATVKYFIAHPHSRLPVLRDGNVDRIAGIAPLKETLQWEQQHDSTTLLADLPLNGPLLISTNTPLPAVFKQMQRHRKHLAIVIDEHGGTVGLVTLEDLLEEVFGEIEDESDPHEQLVRKLAPQRYSVAAAAELEQIAKITGWQLGDTDTDTLAKLLLDQLERLPSKGETVALRGGVIATVTAVDIRRIKTVELRQAPADE